MQLEIDDEKKHLCSPSRPDETRSTSGHLPCHLGCTGAVCSILDIVDVVRLYDFSEDELDPFQKNFSDSSDSQEEEVTVQKIRWKQINRHTAMDPTHKPGRRRGSRRNIQKKFDSTLGYPGEGPRYEDEILDLVIDLAPWQYEGGECAEERCTHLGHGHKKDPLVGKAKRQEEKKAGRKKGKNSGISIPCLDSLCARDCQKTEHSHNSVLDCHQGNIFNEYKKEPKNRASIERVRAGIKVPLSKRPYISLTTRRKPKNDNHATDLAESSVLDAGDAKLIAFCEEELEIVPVFTPPSKPSAACEDKTSDNNTDDHIESYTFGDSTDILEALRGSIDDKLDDNNKAMEIETYSAAHSYMSGFSFTEYLLVEDRKEVLFNEAKQFLGYGRRVHVDDPRLKAWKSVGGVLTQMEQAAVDGNTMRLDLELTNHSEVKVEPELIEDVPLSSPDELPDFGVDAVVHQASPLPWPMYQTLTSSVGDEKASPALQQQVPPSVPVVQVQNAPPQVSVQGPAQPVGSAVPQAPHIDGDLAKRVYMLRRGVKTVHVAFPKTIVYRFGKKIDSTMRFFNRTFRLSRVDRTSVRTVDQFKLGADLPPDSIIRGKEIRPTEARKIVDNFRPGYGSLLEHDRLSVVDILGYTNEVQVTIFSNAAVKLLQDKRLDASTSFRSSGHVVTAVFGRIHKAAESTDIAGIPLNELLIKADRGIWQKTVAYVAYQLFIRDAERNLILPSADIPLMTSVFQELAAAMKPLLSAASIGLRGS
jgi:hypothetical protein